MTPSRAPEPGGEKVTAEEVAAEIVHKIDAAEKEYGHEFAIPWIIKALTEFAAAARAEGAQDIREMLGPEKQHSYDQGYEKGFAEGIEKAAQTVHNCDCEITLDQDGLEHILHHIYNDIKALKP